MKRGRNSESVCFLLWEKVKKRQKLHATSDWTRYAVEGRPGDGAKPLNKT